MRLLFNILMQGGI